MLAEVFWRADCTFSRKLALIVKILGDHVPRGCVGELALPLTGLSTLECGPSTLPGQHSGADTGGRDTGEPDPRM